MSWSPKKKTVSGNQVIDSSITFDNLGCTIDEDNMSSNSATHIPTQQSVKAYVDANGGGGSSQWTTTGSDIYYNTGNVGIGTNDPDSALHVKNGDMRIESTFPRLYLADTNQNSDYSIINSDGSFSIYDDTNAAYRMRITSSGNVGINTTSPASKLHIKSTYSYQNAANGAIRIQNHSVDEFGSIFHIAGTQIADNATYYASGQHLAKTTSSSNINLTGGTIKFFANSGLTADTAFTPTERMRITSSGNVGIGTTSPDAKLHVDGGDVKISSDQNTFNGDGKPTIFFSESAADEVHAAISYHGDDETGNDNFIGIGCSGATPTTQALMKDIHQMVVTTTGNVGIGTTSPDAKLHVQNGDIKITSDSSSGADGIASLLFAEFDDNDASYNANVAHAIIAYNGAGQLGDANYLGFGVFNQSTASEDTLAEQKLLTDLNITRDGNVGIGTTSPDYPLEVNKEGTSGTGSIGLVPDSDNGHYIRYGGSGTNNDVFRLLGVGDSERMRIDTSGNLLVGTTETDIGYTDSGAGFSVSPFGFVQIARSSAASLLYLNKLDNDGDIILFEKDGQGVGSRDGKVGIGNSGINLMIGNNDTGLGFSSSVDAVFPIDTSTGNNRSSAIDLGASTAKFKDLHLSGSVLANTSLNVDNPNGYAAVELGGHSGAYIDLKNPATDDYDARIITSGTDLELITANGDIILNPSANVGIGASNPSAKLHTVGDDSNGTTLATSATNAKVRHENHSASSLSSFQGYTGNSWYTQIANNSGTTSYDLSLNPYGGNVGIGIDSPAQALHVAGKIRLESNFPTIEFVDTDNNPDFTISGGNGSISFYDETNSLHRLLVNSSGNVGIGIADPAFKLSIATPAIPTNSTYQWSLDLSRANDTARGLSFGIASAGTTTAIAAHNADVGIGHTYGVDANNLPQYYETLTVKHTDQSVGKVGIGTTDPHSLLHVDGGDVKISSDSATTNGDGIPTIFFNETTADEVGAQISYHGDDESGDANFIGIGCAGANTTTQALMKEINQMVVTAAGKVGIGTDSPFARLSILGNNIGTGVPLIRMETGGGGLLDIGTSDQSVANPTWTFETGIGEQLSFGDASNEWMRIDSAGQVGIGTNDPQALLHISAGTSGDATIIIEADTDNGNENDNPSIAFKQDGGVLESQIGHTSYGDANQNALKIANSVAAGGIEFLTGTTDGASNASSRMFIDPDGKVGIGTVTPALNLDLNGDIAVRGSVPYIFFQETDTTDLNTAIRNSSGVFNIDTVNDENTTYITRLSVDHSTGYVGVGDITPVTALHVDAGDHNVPATFHSTDLGSYINITDGSSGTYGAVIGTEADEMVFRPNAVTAMRISADGKAAIGGEVNDNVDLKVHGKTQTERLGIGGITGFYNIESYTSSPVHANFDSTSTSGSYIRFEDGNSTSTIPAAIGALGNECFIAANGQERVRIDASGNLGVGTTDPAYKTHISYAKTTDNTIGLRVSYDVSSLDGKIISWGEGTSEGGVLGKADGFGLDASYIANGTTGLRFERTFGTSNRINPCDNTGALLDDIIDLGGSNAKFDDIYATNTSIISSSDRNLKQDIEALTEAELRVALACKGLLRKFRWISAVEEKGDDARIHFGIIAQDLQDAFTAEGLDSGRYGMFIKNTWWEHEGVHYPTAESAPEGADEITRLGVRYSELLAFIIAAI